MNGNVDQYLAHWQQTYRRNLTEDIMPFWIENGLDRQHGGVYTCLDRYGKLMDSTKSVWFQGRFGFVAAYAYNNVEPRAEWLEAARSCIDFLLQHCFDTDGRMFFEVAADGTPLRRRRYLFSECFAAIALAEYSIATGKPEYAERALSIFRLVQDYAYTPGKLEPKYLPAVQAQGHSLTMILINTAARIRAALPSPALCWMTR